MNRREAESDTTENISLISRYEMLLMLENWLEWQQVCGTDYGKINDVSLFKNETTKSLVKSRTGKTPRKYKKCFCTGPSEISTATIQYTRKGSIGRTSPKNPTNKF